MCSGLFAGSRCMMRRLARQKGRSRMAKGKRAAALFEVIQAAKEREQLRAKGGGFLTPSWWFKGQNKANGNTNGEAANAQAPSARSEAPAKKTLAAIPVPVIPEIEAA